jgi:hypothetical protein
MEEYKTSWTQEVEGILEKIRINSNLLSERHRKNFYLYKSYSKYFDIPIIIVSVISSSFSVGANSYIKQGLVSTITCSVSMLVTILTSIKLYLNLDERLKNELEMSKNFHTLGLDIFKVLHLPSNQRGGDGLAYLNKKYSDYIKLIEQSALLRKKIKQDLLTTIPKISGDDSSIESGDTV